MKEVKSCNRRKKERQERRKTLICQENGVPPSKKEKKRRSIAKKYCEGKVKRTPKEESEKILKLKVYKQLKWITTMYLLHNGSTTQ